MANLSISFAKWFIHKHRESSLFGDGNEFDFIIAQLDNHTWDEFYSTINVDALIPLLLQKKIPQKRAPKKIDNQITHTRVDAHTSTDDIDIISVNTEISTGSEITLPDKNKHAYIVDTVIAPIIEKKKTGKKSCSYYCSYC